MLDYSEDTLVEQPAIELFGELGWQTQDCFHEWAGPVSTLGRETMSDVVLLPRLRKVLEWLNPGLPPEAYTAAIEEITRDRSTMSPAHANRELYALLKDGVRVTVRDEEDEETVETLRIIDWQNPANNDYFLASQFWISSEIYKRRADLVDFVNGIPLVFIELKASHKNVKNAYDENLTDYRIAIPQLFHFNGFVILSNGSQSKIGSITAAWEHFTDWKRINDEGEQGVISLETIIRGTCHPARLLDIVENFTVFQEVPGGLVKIVGMNHQYLGVNRAIAALENAGENGGRLGVFWHTQGSGKSISMLFFAQKILRHIPGNWTFLLVTDRQELDDQIYGVFASAGVLTEERTQAESAAHLRRLLSEDHRYVFTLIQKFRTERFEKHPQLTDRSDIIVITDEAHRTQYDIFARNMRDALPNASFIGFTGTPLLAGEEKTRDVFGDYVSIYNFQQSREDGATVPLYYENRIPELQLTNPDLNADMEELLDEALLDDAQEARLEREFAREYHLITRDERLDTIAADIVDHYTARARPDKAMVVSIDKAAAVKMYDRVQHHWRARLELLREQLASAIGPERERLRALIARMEETDMAVVVSQSQNEVERLQRQGVDILPHRQRMVKESLEARFKDPNDPFRIVFVCAMWMTGFDVPSCATIYLDKPMRNHTLMQTIARANRVFPEKVNGVIVDYVGVFRNLQQALAIYAAPPSGGRAGADLPVERKAAQVEQLRQAVDLAVDFLRERSVDPDAIIAASGFARIALLDAAVEAVLENDETKAEYLHLANTTARLYRAILPDEAANEFAPRCTLLAVIANKIQSLIPPADISEVMTAVERLLDESVAAESYVIDTGAARNLIDLSAFDFEALRHRFHQGRKRAESERLRGAISARLRRMLRLNRSRMDYQERFQRMIDEYNTGAFNVDQFFNMLLQFAEQLTEEEQRGIAEQLTEEELALFDLLTRPDIELTEEQTRQVKAIARELLVSLKTGKLVLDWRKKQAARAAVRQTIEVTLDKLPEIYDAGLYRTKCDETYQHIYDCYFGQGRSIYAIAS